MLGKNANRRRKERRFLSVESLENRNLLAAIAGSPFQNPLDCNDLDTDGDVTPSDALTAINAINSGLSGPLAARFAPPSLDGAIATYFDADGDGELSPSDPLMVINKLNSRRTEHPEVPEEIPTEDEDTESPVAIELTDGFARVRAALNTGDDTDTFTVDAVAGKLHVALFTRMPGDATIQILDASGEPVGDPVSTADADRHHPASITVDVAESGTFTILVAGDGSSAGIYHLHVVNKLPDTDEPEGDENPEGDEHPQRPAPPTAAEVFAKLDADGGGTVSAEEFEALPIPPDAAQTHADLFATLDADEDGGLTLEEFLTLPAKPVDHIGPGGPRGEGPGRGGHGPGEPPSAEDVFTNLDADADADGSLSSEEFKLPPHVELAVAEVFAAWDTDGDGLLSPTEFKDGLGTLRVR